MGRTLYVSQQDCYLSLDQERLVVKRAGAVLQQAQLPHLDQILIFGHAQVTTQLIQSCLGSVDPSFLNHQLGIKPPEPPEGFFRICMAHLLIGDDPILNLFQLCFG